MLRNIGMLSSLLLLVEVTNQEYSKIGFHYKDMKFDLLNDFFLINFSELNSWAEKGGRAESEEEEAGKAARELWTREPNGKAGILGAKSFVQFRSSFRSVVLV
jgi:hypothetical protein